ncbi:unnamed protein product [Hymenolepis diminuta]|uniref:Protein kinase domain-containing protein n=1 Tax=Hymenolepis diminuta TaxID=6216 RepID=A0A0R3SY25_HYMDI|nr:unnamed protein product [Hymenolepis diminuta]
MSKVSDLPRGRIVGSNLEDETTEVDTDFIFQKLVEIGTGTFGSAFSEGVTNDLEFANFNSAIRKIDFRLDKIQAK